jgi:acyl phosphate:glycerol-3-phosphate acyltransferase
MQMLRRRLKVFMFQLLDKSIGAFLGQHIIWIAPAGALLLGYLLGSVPFGLLLTRIGGAGDLRSIGSGNIGATNVLRTGRKGLAAATLFLDLGKGVAAVLVAQWINPDYGVLGAVAAFFGHCYPVWLGFKGGKGIATAFGVLLVLAWPVAAVSASVWLLTLAISRYSSASSIAATIVAPIAAAFLANAEIVIALIAVGLVVLWKHRENIARLLAGTESRVGQKSQPVGD